MLVVTFIGISLYQCSEFSELMSVLRKLGYSNAICAGCVSNPIFITSLVAPYTLIGFALHMLRYITEKIVPLNYYYQ